jgi:hypothetical protein
MDMGIWSQHLLVILLVASCLFVVGRQAFASLRGKPGKLGNCCAKGCQPTAPAAESKAKGVAFIPVEMLSHRRHRS